jgi:hypothetical protein
MGRAEMHFGLQSSLFGNVEVHTVIRQNQVGLTISSDKGDLQTILGPEVPTVANALRHYDLQLNPVKFLESGNSSANTLSYGSQDQQRSSQQPGRMAWQARSWAPDSHNCLQEEEAVLGQVVNFSIRA